MRDHVRALLDSIDDRHADLTAAATLLLDAVTHGGIVHAAGAGHSLLMVGELFYRAGGLAPVRPLWDQEVLPLNGALRSSAAEREQGRGAAVLAAAGVAPPDVVIVFSTSGRNPYPVEIAEQATARGVAVIAVTSRSASAKASARSATTVADHATVVLDTGVPPGDVGYPPHAPRTAATSTIACAYLWTTLLAELDDLAEAQGVHLPRWTSSNVPGGDAHNAGLVERYRSRIPELGTET
ncbi:sugar isomerase domain-containing protein [Saccharomonospora sp. NPDC006951]